MIIGLVGTFASGKDTVAEYLEAKKGFEHYSTGDLIREYIKEHNAGGLDRKNLQDVGNELRAKYGSGFLVELAIKRGKPPLAISGIRSTGEAQAVYDAGGFLIAFDAPLERRYAWTKSRGRIDDAMTEAEFAAQEGREISSDDPNHQNITAVIAMASYDIANDGTLDELFAKVDEVLVLHQETSK